MQPAARPTIDNRFQQAKNFSAMGPLAVLKRGDLDNWNDWVTDITSRLKLQALEDANYHSIYQQIIWPRLGRDLQSLAIGLESSLVPKMEPLQYLGDLKEKLHPKASLSYYSFAFEHMTQAADKQVANYHVYLVKAYRKMKRPSSSDHIFAESFIKDLANPKVKQHLILKDRLKMNPDKLLKASLELTGGVLEMIRISDSCKLEANVTLKGLYSSHGHQNQTMKEYIMNNRKIGGKEARPGLDAMQECIGVEEEEVLFSWLEEDDHLQEVDATTFAQGLDLLALSFPP